MRKHLFRRSKDYLKWCLLPRSTCLPSQHRVTMSYYRQLTYVSCRTNWTLKGRILLKFNNKPQPVEQRLFCSVSRATSSVSIITQVKRSSAIDKYSLPILSSMFHRRSIVHRTRIRGNYTKCKVTRLIVCAIHTCTLSFLENLLNVSLVGSYN